MVFKDYLILVLISCLITFLAIKVSNYYSQKVVKFNYYWLYLIFNSIVLYYCKINYQSLVLPAFLVFCLTICTEIDIRIMMIPRLVTLGAQIIAPFFCFFSNWPISFSNSIFSGLVAWSSMWLISYLFYLYKGEEGMGIGDADLLAMIAAYLGLAASFRIIFGASMLGLVWTLANFIIYKKFSNKLPFGPFISAGTALYLINSNLFIQILGW